MKKIISIAVFVLVSNFVFGQTTFVASKEVCQPKNLGIVNCINPGRPPQFFGGDSLMQNYVIKNLVLEKKMHKKAEGKIVKIQFDVDTVGKIWNVRLLNEENIDPEIKNAVVNLICNMPAWIPGGVGSKGDSDYFNVNIRVWADVHYWYSINGKEMPAFISLTQWPKRKISKPKPEEEDIFSFAEVVPNFPDSVGTFQKFITDNMQYPENEKADGKQGTVYVQFVVEKDGSITNVEVVKEVEGAPEFNQEAIRLISAMPKWSPGKMNGRNVRVRVSQPVKFVL